MSLVRSYWEGTSLKLFLPRGCRGVIFAARLSWGYFCREATIYLYRTTGHSKGYKNCWCTTIASLDIGPWYGGWGCKTYGGRKRYQLSGPVRDTPPYRAILFRDSIARGVHTHLPCFHVISRKYRWDTPFVGGGGYHGTSTKACFPRGKRPEKGKGYRTELAMLRHQNPIARNRRVSLR